MLPTAVCLTGSHRPPQCSDVTCPKAPTSLFCAPAIPFFRELCTVDVASPLTLRLPPEAPRLPWPQPAPCRDTALRLATCQYSHHIIFIIFVTEGIRQREPGPMLSVVHGIIQLLGSCCKHLLRGRTGASMCSKPQTPRTSRLSPLQPYLVLSSGKCFLTWCPQETACSAEPSIGTVCPSLASEWAFTSGHTSSERPVPQRGSRHPGSGSLAGRGVTVLKQILGFPPLLRTKHSLHRVKVSH